MKQEIFILVNVTYDHFRFQDNLFASTSRDECYKFAKDNYKEKLIFDYEWDSQESEEYDDRELNHLWIQKL